MAHAPNPAAKLQHVRPVRPLFFTEQEPDSEHLGQSPRHHDLCYVLTMSLRMLVGDGSAVACDMFVY